MVATYLINEALLRIIGAGLNLVLRAIGGPDHVPNENEDFVWY